ncbi:hypothetical protein [Gordonia humi]|uniref:Lipoprotein n=1 Tax=Gordonia humi TaxID=686429 RepID=A0A840F441_9ACTN|nr:hypothetical protein [Gordonia humi]MBB4136229.1 hypothetical protein [Gordonia humi]
MSRCIHRYSVALATICLAAGCSSAATPTPLHLPESSTTVEFTYIGSSTPPPYHEEYVVEISDGEATARIGTYRTVRGTVDPESTSRTTVRPAQWQTMVDALTALPDPVEGEDGCAGGSTYAVLVKDAGRTVVDRSDYACGSGSDAVVDAYTAFIAPIAPALGLP